MNDRIDPETGEVIPVGGLMKASDQLPAEISSMLQEYAGAGYSDKPEDGLTPILAILQDNSGEVKERHDRHVAGAKAGMLIIRSLRKMYSGEDGLLIQPFGFNHVYVEWTGELGEGIPVARYMFDDPPPDLIEVPSAQNPDKMVLRRKSNGNRMVDTREHYANIISDLDPPFPVVIPMSGSNHGVSRSWTIQMRTMLIAGKPAPAFARLYKLKTQFRKRGSNMSWFSYYIDPGPRVVDIDLIQLGIRSFKGLAETPIEANLGDLAGSMDDEQKTAAPSTVNTADVI